MTYRTKHAQRVVVANLILHIGPREATSRKHTGKKLRVKKTALAPSASLAEATRYYLPLCGRSALRKVFLGDAIDGNYYV